MALETVVWLLVLVVLAILSSLVLRRMSTLIARTRDLERYQKAVAALDVRSAAVVDPLVRSSTRRAASADPGALAGRRPAVQASVAGSRRRRGPSRRRRRWWRRPSRSSRSWTGRRAPPTWPSTGSTRSRPARRGRDLEAQTSLKRGALNLRHAREAIARLAREVAAVRPVDIATQPRRAPMAVPARHGLPGPGADGPPRAASNPACSGILDPHHKG